MIHFIIKRCKHRNTLSLWTTPAQWVDVYTIGKVSAISLCNMARISLITTSGIQTANCPVRRNSKLQLKGKWELVELVLKELPIRLQPGDLRTLSLSPMDKSQTIMCRHVIKSWKMPRKMVLPSKKPFVLWLEATQNPTYLWPVPSQDTLRVKSSAEKEENHSKQSSSSLLRTTSLWMNLPKWLLRTSRPSTAPLSSSS